MAAVSCNDTFADFFGDICRFFKKEGCVDKISSDFACLVSDRERFVFVSELMLNNELRPSCLNKNPPSKCLDESIRLRNEGNDLFIKGEEKKSLKLYTRSALLAPTSTELSMAYANRSAVLYALGRYEDSIVDIRKAMGLEYPNHLKFKLLKRKGECLCKLGKHLEAKQSLEQSLSLLMLTSNLPEKKRKEIEINLNSFLSDCQLNHSEIPELSSENNESIPSLGNLKSKEVPSASVSVEICCSENYGRHVVACKNIKPGEIIVIERPFASILLPEFYLSHCYHCFKRSLTLLPCENCCHVMFCCEECRRNSWNRYHAKECAVLYYILKLDLGKMAHLALRIVLSLEFSTLKDLINAINLNPYSKSCREKGFSENGTYISSDYTPIYHLEGHSDKRYISDLFKRTCMTYCIVSCLAASSLLESTEACSAKDLEILLGELILRHLQNLPCNAHEVSELFVECPKTNILLPDAALPQVTSSLVEIGGAAYAVLSLINHSCDPNVVRHSYNGSNAILRAIRPINKGEQILDNYGYHYATHSIKVRQDNLKEQYFFECKCTACIQMWPPYQLLRDEDFIENLLCPKCRNSPIEKLDGKSSSDECDLFICKACNMSAGVTDLKKELAKSSEQFKIVLSAIFAGEKVDVNTLIKHLILMDKALKRPWKEYNDCQEALKHCYALEGNCFKV